MVFRILDAPRERATLPQGGAAVRAELDIVCGVAANAFGMYTIGSGVSALVPADYTQTGSPADEAETQHGQAVVIPSGGTVYVDGKAPGSENYSIIAFWTPTGATGANHLAPIDSDGASSSTSAPRTYQFRIYTTTVDFIPFNTAGSAFTISVTPASVTSTCVMVATVDGLNTALYYAEYPFNNFREVTGTMTGTAQSGGAIALHRFFTTLVSGPTTGPAIGQHYYGAVAGRAWSRDTVFELLQNPAALFEHEELPMFLPAAATGPDIPAARRRLMMFLYRHFFQHN